MYAWERTREKAGNPRQIPKKCVSFVISLPPPPFFPRAPVCENPGPAGGRESFYRFASVVCVREREREGWTLKEWDGRCFRRQRRSFLSGSERSLRRPSILFPLRIETARHMHPFFSHFLLCSILRRGRDITGWWDSVFERAEDEMSMRPYTRDGTSRCSSFAHGFLTSF